MCICLRHESAMAAFEVDDCYGKQSWAVATGYAGFIISQNKTIGKATDACSNYRRIFKVIIKYEIEMKQEKLNSI